MLLAQPRTPAPGHSESDRLMYLIREVEKLVVVDPPFYSTSWPLIVSSLFLIGLAHFLRRYGEIRWWWTPLVFLIPIGILGAYLLGSSTVLTFDQEKCTIHEVTAFYFESQRIIPLNQIQQALLGRGRKTTGLVLRLTSGQEYVQRNFSDRGGHNQAVEAINRHLDQHRR